MDLSALNLAGGATRPDTEVITEEDEERTCPPAKMGRHSQRDSSIAELAGQDESNSLSQCQIRLAILGLGPTVSEKTASSGSGDGCEAVS